MTPLVRVGEAQDIANGVLFLCTEAANYMTGQELVSDGGITAADGHSRAAVVPVAPRRRAGSSSRRCSGASPLAVGAFAAHGLDLST